MFEEQQKVIAAKIRTYCTEHHLPQLGEINWNPIPFSGEWGISTSFFALAAAEARLIKEQGGQALPVHQRAQELAREIAADIGSVPGFSHIEAVNGYLNLYFSSAEYIKQVVDRVLSEGANFGRGASRGEQVMVEFSQPNTHKAFHVGHLRSAILGEVLSRILEFAGYDVVRSNYIGDTGLHVIKWLWNYMMFHAGETPPEDATQWMGELYAEANRRLEENPDLEVEVRALYGRWDRREPEVVETWERTRQWSLDGFAAMYQTLGIHFDRYYFPSAEEQPGKKVVDELIQRGIAIDERPTGPVIVRIDELLGLTKEKYRVLVVLRSDGTPLYSTEDLALAEHKFAEYPKMSRSIYIVDVRQALHFQQVFKTLEIAGRPWADRCLHLGYEIVNLPGNVTMASREGTVVLLESLLREAVSRARKVVEEKNPDLSDEQKNDVARAVGHGALKYPMLARDIAKIVTFDWESALDFNGQAALYIQYAQVRANAIFRKLDEFVDIKQPVEFDYPLDPTEIQLIDIISRFPGEVQRSAAEFKTLLITNIAYEMARAFSDFYNNCPVLKADPPVRAARLRLVAAARQAMVNALNLMAIEAPDVM
jgi:arginyl-tRNA synthetase